VTNQSNAVSNRRAKLAQAQKYSIAASVATLILLFIITLGAAWTSFGQTIPSGKSAQPANQDSPAKAVTSAEALSSDQRLQIQTEIEKARDSLASEIKAENADQRLLLGSLLTLTGLYSSILGLTAFFTLKLAREDAQAQIARSATDLRTFQDTTTDFTDSKLGDMEKRTKLKLDAFQGQIEEFQKRIWTELPEMRNLKDSLRDLLLDLERFIPAESNWNDEKPYESLTEPQKQQILIAEATVGALQIFISRDSIVNRETMAKLYRALARFYFGRYRLDRLLGDAERADIYVLKSLEMEPEHGGAYGLRGAIYLARYRLGAGGPEAALLRDKAESYLGIALSKDDNDLGVYYNLALALCKRNALDEALQRSNEALANLDRFPKPQIRKYAPALYGNVASYLAIQADEPKNASKQNSLRKEAVLVLQNGGDFLSTLKFRPGVESYISIVERELGPKGDFRNLDPDSKTQVEKLLALWSA